MTNKSLFDNHYSDYRACWTAFRQGDKVAFSVIYQNHLDALFNYGMKVIPDRNLVKDSLQDLFIDLWRNRLNLSETDQIRYYLYTAFRRKLIREAQKSRRLSVLVSSADIAETVVLSVDHLIISEELKLERKALLLRGLKKIPIRQQEVLNLLYYENYTYEQISQMMGIHVKSVYTLAWKAFASLRKGLKVHS